MGDKITDSASVLDEAVMELRSETALIPDSLSSIEKKLDATRDSLQPRPEDQPPPTTEEPSPGLQSRLPVISFTGKLIYYALCAAKERTANLDLKHLHKILGGDFDYFNGFINGAYLSDDLDMTFHDDYKIKVQKIDTSLRHKTLDAARQWNEEVDYGEDLKQNTRERIDALVVYAESLN